MINDDAAYNAIDDALDASIDFASAHDDGVTTPATIDRLRDVQNALRRLTLSERRALGGALAAQFAPVQR